MIRGEHVIYFIYKCMNKIHLNIEHVDYLNQ